MTLVRIVKSWQKLHLLHLTPHGSGRWEDVQFTHDPVEQCDYLLILNGCPEDTVVRCPQDNVWALIQEPPIDSFQWLVKGLKAASRIYTPDTTTKGTCFIHSHGALPWHVNKAYDELTNAPVPHKSRNLSWITSSKNIFKGHRHRMEFLERIRPAVNFDLWGHGLKPIADKWDGLASYRYSLAIENYSGPYYWSEKIADCYLSWTMPIYYGCTNLTDYFPAESFIAIDIHDPNVVEQINDIIASNRWQQSLDALAHARELVLNRYQLFPFIADRIHQHQQMNSPGQGREPSPIRMKSIFSYSRHSPQYYVRRYLRQVKAKVLAKLRG